MNTWRRVGTWLRLLRLLPHLPNLVRLGWRLFRDRRVPVYLKGMVVAALLYVVSPVDLVPDLLSPFLGSVDDVTLLLLAGYGFLRWSPQAVVAEHVAAIGGKFRERCQR
jgi:uncharacterized membrane protein YkvA (DUF1232 family)